MDGCIIGRIIGILSGGLEYACNGCSCMKKRLIAFAFKKKLAPVGSENTKIVYCEIQELLLPLNTNGI